MQQRVFTFHSSFFLISCCIILLFSGCSPKKAPQVPYSQVLSARYGIAQSQIIDNYLLEFEKRLTGHLPEGFAVQSQITVINTDIPLAYSADPGSVLVSKGLIFRLANEAEFAFIVGHEIAHQALGHLNYDLEEVSPNTRAQMELAADFRALGMIAYAGYDPRAAIGAMARASQYSDLTTIDAQAAYPPLEDRIHRAREAIRISVWTPPGILDRRDFREFRDSLMATSSAQ